MHYPFEQMKQMIKTIEASSSALEKSTTQTQTAIEAARNALPSSTLVEVLMRIKRDQEKQAEIHKNILSQIRQTKQLDKKLLDDLPEKPFENLPDVDFITHAEQTNKLLEQILEELKQLNDNLSG